MIRRYLWGGNCHSGNHSITTANYRSDFSGNTVESLRKGTTVQREKMPLITIIRVYPMCTNDVAWQTEDNFSSMVAFFLSLSSCGNSSILFCKRDGETRIAGRQRSPLWIERESNRGKSESLPLGLNGKSLRLLPFAAFSIIFAVYFLQCLEIPGVFRMCLLGIAIRRNKLLSKKFHSFGVFTNHHSLTRKNYNTFTNMRLLIRTIYYI